MTRYLVGVLVDALVLAASWHQRRVKSALRETATAPAGKVSGRKGKRTNKIHSLYIGSNVASLSLPLSLTLCSS